MRTPPLGVHFFVKGGGGMEDLVLRRQPYSAEAEQSVLGSLLIDPACISEAIEIVAADDFYIPENKKIFETMTSMYTLGQKIDPVILLDELKNREIYDEAGGRAYLYKLVEITPTAANVKAYAQIVRAKAKLRKLAKITGEANERALAEAGEANELIESLEQQLFEMRGEKQGQGLVHIRSAIMDSIELLNELSKTKGGMPGIPTGFSDLDYYITGLNKSDLILLAARPGIGKTSVALNIARNASKSGKNIAVFNLEMSRTQLVQRMLSSEGMIDLKKIKTADLTDDEWDRLARASKALSSASIYIDDTANITVAEIKARCRRLPDLGLVIIDYLQLISGTRKDGNRVCLSQLSRASDQRKERPRLSDLRDSGAIEQDADIVLFLYKDEDYNPDTADKNVCECIIAKNRNGQTNTVKFRWLGQFTRFVTQDNRHVE